MSNQPIDISIPDLSGKEEEYLSNCIETNYVSSVGPFVSRFEEAISQYINLPKECVTSTNSGTSALHLALIASGIKRNDLVIIPSYTFIATANAVINAGGIPWFIDILEDSLIIDSKLIESEIQEKTFLKSGFRFHKELGYRVFALVPVHVFGNAPDLDSLINLSEEYNLELIADSAGGLGSIYKGKQLGEAVPKGIISFNGNKIITSGGGGIYYSKDKNSVEMVKHLSSTARKSVNYVHDKVGFNFRISNLHAAVGLAQIERMDNIIKKKLSIKEKYAKSFKSNKVIKLIEPIKSTCSSNWLNAIVVSKDLLFNLEELINILNSKNIRIRHYWRPIHMQEPYRGCPCSIQEISSNIYSRIIVLPSSTNLTNGEIEYTIQEIKRYFNF